MVKIAHLRDVSNLNDQSIPAEVIAVIEEIANILDTEYGKERDVAGDNGGYILLITDEKDLQVLGDQYIDLDAMFPEYVDKIPASTGEQYTHSLLLLGSDYTVSLIMPLEITPIRFLYREGWEE